MDAKAGYETAAESWGTGRAVARIPRVPGGGTHRSGQAAFGNMCRGGGMFAPLKTWRKWHRKSNKTMKRHAVAAALAATAVPALVMARGHKVDEVPELPLVIQDSAEEGITKTKQALALLKKLGAGADLTRAASSKTVRAGRGKARNRRTVMRKGPLVIHNMGKEQMAQAGLAKAVRNLPGVEVAHVDRLNLLQLAPGGSIGRFCVFTEGAIKRLATLFGSKKAGSSSKKGFTLMRAPMTNTDISRIVNSDEIQSVLSAKRTPHQHVRTRKNPLKNASVLNRLCPYALASKKKAIAKASKKDGKKTKKHTNTGKAFMKALEEAHKVKKVEETAAEEAA